MTTALVSKISASAAAKSAFYILITSAATGAATGLTYNSINPHYRTSPISNHHSPPLPFLRSITTTFNGVVRSARALCTITANVVDYKYSLHGLCRDSEEYRRVLSEVHLRSAKRILELCEINKGFYVKAGQFVSAMRQVPKEYASTLAALQDQAVPYSFEAIKEVLTNNLGPDLTETFLSIDEQPIAAASIAQVHHAVLKDHQEVAIKVQYPGLKDRMRLDIEMMSLLAKCVAWLFPEYRFQWMVSEFSKSITLELDFIQEAKNSEKTAANFKEDSMLMVPSVFWEVTTSQVLTMQFCRGKKVDDLDFMKEMGIDPRKVAKAVVEAFAEMIFVHGFVHGDPQPANILVSSEGKGGFRLVLLDHGIYRSFTEEFRVNYCQLWKALILLDSQKVQQIGESFGIGKYSRYLPLVFTGRTINSKSALGEGMSVKEKMNLKLEVKSLTIGNVSEFLESLPSEFLAVLRTDELLKSLTTKLGAPKRIRLLVYAKYAFQCLSPKLNSESDSVSKLVFTGIMSRMSYLQVRLLLESLQLLSWLEDTRQLFIAWLKQIVILTSHILGRVLPPFYHDHPSTIRF